MRIVYGLLLWCSLYHFCLTYLSFERGRSFLPLSLQKLLIARSIRLAFAFVSSLAPSCSMSMMRNGLDVRLLSSSSGVVLCLLMN